LKDLESEFTGFSTIIGEGVFTRDGTADVERLFGFRAFDFPKPVDLLASVIEQGAGKDDIILDFFAGSGTTAHAVMRQNAVDGGSRRYILVQLPERLDAGVAEQKAAADFCEKIGKPKNIAELTKERLRRAASDIKSLYAEAHIDAGFRSFKLDTTNIREWSPDRDNVAGSLEEAADHLKTDRSEEDILFELLLKLGLDLTSEIESRSLGDHVLHSIGAGTLLVCLSVTIERGAVEGLASSIVALRNELAPAGDTQIVFRDSAFVDDVAKTNMAAILQQNGLERIRSI
jgi:adenine-specific DNA-methyltransferase